jgi:signal transduction histidine kinase/ligand-binding sensor domain-containing protein
MWRGLRARWTAGLVLALGLSVGAVAWGATGKKAESIPFQYTRTIWRVPDGLPEDTVQTVAESAQGLLWIGTTGGLAKFDGARMQLYEGGRTQMSSVNSIFCLTVARNGDLWAGTEGGGLLQISGGSVRVYAGKEGLSDGFVRSVFEDDRGRLWVGTDGGLFYKDGQRFKRWEDDRDGAPLAVHSITEDSEHRLWVGGSRLFTIDAQGTEQEYVLPGAYSENRVKRILQTKDGTVWVGTVGGLQRLRGGRFEVVAGIKYTVRTLLQTDDGTLWVGTIGGGLWTLRMGQNGDGLTRVSEGSLLPSDTVLAIFEDDQRQVWVGTQAGLVRLNRTPVSVVALPEGGDPDFETISGDDRGSVWVAAQRLYVIHDGVARPVSYGEGSPFTVRNIFRARDGALWIGTDGGGAYRVQEGGGTTHYTAPGELTNNFVRGFLETRDGTIWIACDEGVSLIGPSGERKLTEANGLAYFSTRSLLEDREGGVWIGTDRGLSHWVAGGFREDVATRTLAQEKVWSILQDRTGTLWFGTRDHGLFRYRDGAIGRLTTNEGLPTNSIYQLLQNRRGTFWLTGPNVMASIQESDMTGDAPTAARPLSVTVYSLPFGADGAQLYGGRQPSGYVAPDDTVWFPTNRGAAHIAGREQETGPGPKVFLEDVRADGLEVRAKDGELTIPARVSRISFQFSAAFLRAQQGLRFQYELENFDKGWNVADSSREATYTNLAAGTYRFRVRAFDTAQPMEMSEASLGVSKEPFFYQKWWFYTLCFLLLGGIGWSLYEFRLRQLRARFDAALQERSRLAREMHDTVIQGCTGISALLEAVAITPTEDVTTRDELLEYARKQARMTVSEARQVVWDMRHEQEGAVELVGALRLLVEQNRPEAGTVIALAASVERMEATASVGHEILMTVREAMLNALQHSGSRELRVGVEMQGTEVLFTVTDDGCGFATGAMDAEDGDHYGILGMKERADRLGGRLKLTSAPKAGTKVELVVAAARLLKSVARSG